MIFALWTYQAVQLSLIEWYQSLLCLLPQVTWTATGLAGPVHALAASSQCSGRTAVGSGDAAIRLWHPNPAAAISTGSDGNGSGGHSGTAELFWQVCF